MNRSDAHIPSAPVVLAAFALSLSFSGGCLVTTGQHEALQREVASLQKKVATRDQELQDSLAKSAAQSEEIDRVLRSRAANLGVSVDNLELDVAELRGQSEDARNDIAALLSETRELRAELDRRVADLEQRVNRATEIPEGKVALRREADRLLASGDNRQARRFYRTYLSRYPGDKREPEIRFNVGLTLYNERDFRAALGEFYWIVQQASQDPIVYDALYYSGLAFAKLGQCDKATAYFQALAAEEKAPPKYRKTAADQVKIFEADDGTICTDRKADGGRTDTRDATEATPAEDASKAPKPAGSTPTKPPSGS